MSDVAVVGLGKMGSALATSLLGSGRSVTVWNRSHDKTAPLAQIGAQTAPFLQQVIASSEVIVVCLRNHATTMELLSSEASSLSGKTVIDLSTGGAEEAEELVSMLVASGARWMIGMINAYPSGIGKPETAILCAGPLEVWEDFGDTVKVLGGASTHVGTTAAAVPGLFAAMFTARQGLMFGLIYGGAVCRKAGLPLQSFADQVPVTVEMAKNYADLFIRTVPEGKFDDPGATVQVYLNALEDVVSTFAATGTTDAFPRMMRDLTQRAVGAGLGDKELTALVEMLAED